MEFIGHRPRVADAPKLDDKIYQHNPNSDIFYHNLIPCRNPDQEMKLMEVLAFAGMPWEGIWRCIKSQRARSVAACPLIGTSRRCALCDDVLGMALARTPVAAAKS